MEMHLVHRNKKFLGMEEALDHTDGLTVLAFFFQISEKENKPLNQILRHLPRVYHSDARVFFTSTFTLASILPKPKNMKRFYMYTGSLTTPPCSEAVTWIVFPNPMPVSNKQVNKFRSMLTHDNHTRLTCNFRCLQKINTRSIFYRKSSSQRRNSNPFSHRGSIHL
ncbi:carbonic anhydrase 15-like [Agrilus planipennis]|uniref:Carbonic anhydrase 15-like n=1 Tax=Agrilus planipennis TaxID=224129 RepID=A0A7F5R4H7_AGRPL|nr:carbonic anhydrase 15-like [Agrilus planipennis]